MHPHDPIPRELPPLGSTGAFVIIVSPDGTADRGKRLLFVLGYQFSRGHLGRRKQGGSSSVAGVEAPGTLLRDCRAGGAAETVLGGWAREMAMRWEVACGLGLVKREPVEKPE